jgi:antitoxin VapB
MALSIKDRATEDAVRALAAATGEGLTTAVRKAAEERLLRVRRVGGKTVLEDIMEIAAHCATLPDLDTRTADDIIGYDEFGLPA